MKKKSIFAPDWKRDLFIDLQIFLIAAVIVAVWASLLAGGIYLFNRLYGFA